jgi:uncharacterized protein
VSGSMEEESEEIYLLLFLIKNIVPKTELFVFSTELLRLTNALSFNNFRDSSQRLSKKVKIWGSGTRIGKCLQEFLKKYGTRVDSGSTIIIISDGWDLGDPKILDDSMRGLKRRGGWIIWLNPYAEIDEYRPEAIGMKTALPYVDIFASTDVFSNRQTFNKYFGRETSPLLKTAVPTRARLRLAR